MEARGKDKFLSNITSIFNQLEHIDLPISIFKVQNSIAFAKPEAYIPHLVGLGPYHHMRPELQQIQMVKLNEAKRIHEGFQCVAFDRLVHLLYCLVGPAVRACYSMYLDINDEDLATIMAVDGLFLFELLCFYGVGRDDLAKSAFFGNLFPSGGWRLVQVPTCLKESMMLENQIPILVLKILMLIECSFVSKFSRDGEAQTEAYVIVKSLFPRMLLSYCRAVSPLQLVEKYPSCKVLKHKHLLDLLYNLIVLKEAPCLEPGEEEREERFLKTVSTQVESLQSSSVATPTPIPVNPLAQSAILAKAIEVAGDVIPEVAQPIQLVTGLLQLPWQEMWTTISYSPLVEEEIFIPTASQLHKNGVKFNQADHITDIKFNSKTVSFHLPMIKLNGSSEVVIRNLAAYEAMTKSEYEELVFTRYVEIMSGIIETVEDVKVLKENKILEFDSIREVEVVEMFRGMKKSTRLTNAKDLDKAIKDVNEYYNSLWKVSVSKTAKKWWSSSWNVFRVIAVLVIFAILVLHTFCTVYGCSRWFGKNRTSA